MYSSIGIGEVTRHDTDNRIGSIIQRHRGVDLLAHRRDRVEMADPGVGPGREPPLGIERGVDERRDAQELADARALASRLGSARLAVKAKAGSTGKLFGAVTNADVAAAVAAALGIAVDKHKIELGSPIKALGSYPVEIKLYKNVVAKAAVEVVSA